MEESSLEEKGAAVDRIDGHFEHHIMYRQTSKAHKMDLNEAADRFDSDSDASVRRTRISFSTLDNVKVFYPDPTKKEVPSKNRRSRWTLEDNIMKIGETTLYTGRLNKRVEVMATITEMSPRRLSPKIPEITSVPEKKQVKKRRGKNIPLAPLIKINSKQKEGAVGDKTGTGGSYGQSKKILHERERQEKILPKKYYKKKTITRNIETSVPKLPAILPVITSTGKTKLTKVERQNMVKLPFLPHPPNKPKVEYRRTKAWKI